MTVGVRTKVDSWLVDGMAVRFMTSVTKGCCQDLEFRNILLFGLKWKDVFQLVFVRCLIMPCMHISPSSYKWPGCLLESPTLQLQNYPSRY